jgi:hypothetical protein
LNLLKNFLFKFIIITIVIIIVIIIIIIIVAVKFIIIIIIKPCYFKNKPQYHLLRTDFQNLILINFDFNFLNEVYDAIKITILTLIH